jgi:branched-chain amino acid aminotransferase
MNRVWLNGARLAAQEARIDPADRGFTLGDGVFETIRASAGVPDYGEQHLARLRHGAKMLGIDIPYTDTVLLAALASIADRADCALRLTLTRGPMARGILPVGPAHATVLITALPLPAPLPPARVMIARSTVRNERSPLSRIKSLNYLDSIMARQEAHAAGYDDALLLNTRGTLAEASAANVFLLCNGHWITPPVADGALPGLARSRLLARGVAKEATVTLGDLARATGGFLVNSLGTRALAAIDGCELLQVIAL